VTFTVGSLFAGIGGFDLGFERAGFKTVWQVEIDDYCRKVLARHFPDAERYADIRECGANNLRPVDVICGGDPCQRNSNAGRNGGGIESPAAEFIRIVEELRPRIVLRENPSVVRADAPWPWWRFRSELERLGYAVLPFRLRACCAGLDTERERLFLLASLPDANRSRLEGDECEELERADNWRSDSHPARPDRRYATPRICRGADGIPHRVDRLRALGNSVVPQIPELIARRILCDLS
jgi:DNA (cytosine-5)-methyltransferase 1